MCACVEHGNQRVMTFNGVEKKKRPFFFLFFHECSSISLRFLFFSPIFLSPPFRPFWWTGTTRRNDSSTTDSLPPSYSNQEHNHHRYFLVAITWPSAFKLWVHSSRHRQPLPFKFFFSDEIDDVTVSCGAWFPFFYILVPNYVRGFYFLLLSSDLAHGSCCLTASSSLSVSPFLSLLLVPFSIWWTGTLSTHAVQASTHTGTPSFFAGIKCGQCSTIDVIDNWTSRCGIDCDNKCLNVNRHLSIFARSQMHARAQFECCATLLTFRNQTKIVVWPTRKVKLGGQSHFNFISFKCSPYGACCCYTASNERPSLLKRECKKKKLKGKELT